MIFIDINIFIDKLEFNIFELTSNNRKEIIRDEIIIPKSFDIGNKLNYLRKFMKMLINQYNIKKAYINIEDSIGVDIVDIVKIEGIVEEVFSNRGVSICK
ncbi:hypothetical protein QOZ84_04220 [Romboutsia sedimentorum]|uniref:Uncharacterized protein n=1 Tax=Romboutsia sedimentorum TaxID=1368474 RepID=A0ABT7E9V0_9FIRM|nr:hypothetical protein [Romboutsia sedimentorum]MDK2562746.1 hypothetical protein [Romboutsia sedimentorum]MDK2585771.1 hypothetical protein [Romboutsia sedimentorum]